MPDKKIVIKKVAIADLLYGPEQVPYQRPLTESRALPIAENPDDHLLGVPEISVREDGSLVVFDGQHRVHGYKLAGVKEITCRLHYGLSYREEVALYRKANKLRAKLERLDDHVAALEEGDPDALALDRAVKAAGFQIGRGGGPNRLSAIGELYSMYKRNESLLTESLVMCRVWLDHLRGDRGLTAEQIGGVHLVMHMHPEIDRARLERILVRHPATWWSSEADLATNSQRRAARVAIVIEAEYNKRLKDANKRLAPAAY